MRDHVEAMLAFWIPASRPLEYGTTSARWPRTKARARLRFPASCGLYPSAVLQGQSPVPLGGASPAIRRHLQDRPEGEGAAAGQQASAQWLDMAREAQSLSKACPHASAGRPRRSSPLGLAFTNGAQRRLKAPSSSARHLDIRLGRLAEPRDRGDEGRVRRRLRLAAPERLLNTASGATWVSLHHGGGVGMGFSQAFRHGDLLRRYGRCGAPRRARPVERPGNGRLCATPMRAMTLRSTVLVKRPAPAGHIGRVKSGQVATASFCRVFFRTQTLFLGPCREEKQQREPATPARGNVLMKPPKIRAGYISGPAVTGWRWGQTRNRGRRGRSAAAGAGFQLLDI